MGLEELFVELPKSIDVEVVCQGAQDLSGLIVEITVHAGRKNPRHIHFPKTDDTGHASMSADDFRGQFEDHWEVGLMDYDGTLESASQFVHVSLFDVARFRQNLKYLSAWPLLTNERKKWSSRKEFVDYFLSCRNDLFEGVRRVRFPKLPVQGTLRFEVRLRA